MSMQRSLARPSFSAAMLGIGLIGLISCLAHAADQGNPLESRGFEKFGSKWVLKEELALKRDIDTLEEIVKRTTPLRRQVELAVADNAQRWQRQQVASKLIDQIAVAMKRNAVGTDEEKKVQQQIDLLKRELRDGVAPDRFGGQPHMRAMLESLTLMHQQASVLAIRIEAQSGQIHARYHELPESAHMWIAEQPRENLGPLFRAEQVEQVVRKARASMNLDEIPLFLQGQQKRIGIVLGDQYPTVVTVSPKTNALILTSNMAYSIGLRSLGEVESITLPGGQKASARSGKLTQLRIGTISMQDVSVMVLEPSDEHLGGYLGLRMLQAWNPQFADSGVGLSLDPTTQVSTASR